MDESRLAWSAAMVAAATGAGPAGDRFRAQEVAGLTAEELVEVQRVLQRSADFVLECRTRLDHTAYDARGNPVPPGTHDHHPVPHPPEPPPLPAPNICRVCRKPTWDETQHPQGYATPKPR